jgi:hypothetical protein
VFAYLLALRLQAHRPFSQLTRFMATFGDGLKRDTVCSVCTPRRAG